MAFPASPLTRRLTQPLATPDVRSARMQIAAARSGTFVLGRAAAPVAPITRVDRPRPLPRVASFEETTSGSLRAVVRVVSDGAVATADRARSRSVRVRSSGSLLLYLACVLLGIVAACVVRDGGALLSGARASAAKVLHPSRERARPEAKSAREAGSLHITLASTSSRSKAIASAESMPSLVRSRRAPASLAPAVHGGPTTDALFEDFEPSFRVAQ